MKIVSWNCRGLGGPSTISQLKETLRVHGPDLVFICETKQSRPFVQTVCRKLKLKNRWDAVNPRGRSGGLLIFWSLNVQVIQVVTSPFSIEVEFQCSETKGSWWGVFVYCSVDEKERREQWLELSRRRQNWGDRWFLGGGILMIYLRKLRSRGVGKGHSSPLTSLEVLLIIWG